MLSLEEFKQLKPGTLLFGKLYGSTEDGKPQLVEVAEGPNGNSYFSSNTHILVWGPYRCTSADGMVESPHFGKSNKLKELQHRKFWIHRDQATIVPGEW